MGAPDAEQLLTRFKSLIHNAQNLATTAAPSSAPSTQHMVHASTISSNTLRQEGSTKSIGLRGSGVGAQVPAELLLQQMLHGMSEQRTEEATTPSNHSPPASANSGGMVAQLVSSLLHSQPPMGGQGTPASARGYGLSLYQEAIVLVCVCIVKHIDVVTLPPTNPLVPLQHRPPPATHEQSMPSISFPQPSWLKTSHDPMRTSNAAAGTTGASGSLVSTTAPTTQPSSSAGDMLQALAHHVCFVCLVCLVCLVCFVCCDAM